MHRSRRTRGHLAGVLVAAVGGASVAIIFAGSEVGAAAAAPKTVTVTFTDQGPRPHSVRVNSGDSVRYVNQLTQGGSVTLAGGVLAQVQSAGVTVHDAATADFDLPTLDSSRTLTYTGPLTVNYSATYTMTLVPVLSVLGVSLLPDPVTRSTTGRLSVAAPPSQPLAQQDPGAGQPPADNTGAGGAAQGQSPEGAPAGAPPDAPADAPAPADRQTGGGLSHQAPGPSVADRVVPHGGAGSAASVRPRIPIGTGQDQSAPADQALPPPSDYGSGTPPSLVDAASRNAGLGLPAVIAVILLSVVTAALVRTLITQRRALTA
jgi:plastocyanin